MILYIGPKSVAEFRLFGLALRPFAFGPKVSTRTLSGPPVRQAHKTTCDLSVSNLLCFSLVKRETRHSNRPLQLPTLLRQL